MKLNAKIQRDLVMRTLKKNNRVISKISKCLAARKFIFHSRVIIATLYIVRPR